MLYWFLGIVFIAILTGSIAALIILHGRLKRSRFVIESFLGSTINGKIVFDAKGRFYAANKSAIKTLPLLQTPDSPPALQDVFDYMYDNAVDIDANLRNAIVSSTNDLNEDDENFREVIQLPTGRLFLMIAQKSNQNFTLLIMIDVSRQWRQEAIFTLLGEKNNQLMLAIEASNIGVIISMPKREGNPVSFANAAVTQMTGIPRERLSNGYWHQLCEVFAEDDLADKLADAFDQQMPTEIPLTRTTENGRLHWFSLAITPVFDEFGGVDLFIGVLKDTTEFKVREAEFFQAQKLEALGQLSAGIAHDFNNILSIIDGYTRLAAKQVDKDTVICADYLERVCIATQRGAALTKRMLTFSRHKIIAEKTCELGQVIRDQEILLGAVIDPSIKLQVEVLADNIYVQCAPDTIAQIVMNLVINSRDAIGAESGVIKVCAEQVLRSDLTPETLCKLGSAKAYAMLSIIDSGCGISADIEHKIFDPFFTTKSAEKGTGLGMSVVYGLVKDMKGCIEIQSGLQAGATIRIYIPLSKKVPVMEAPADSFTEDRGLKGFTAMVVDDEPDILEITASMLRGAGMKVLEAIDGNDALDRQEDYEGEIHILVTDILMPELNGVKLSELFKSLRPETQVLFMSGYPSGRDYEYIRVPQSTPFLAKPVEYSKLIVLIEALLGVNEVPHQDNIAAMGDNLDHWHTDNQAKKLKN